jgi:DNA topoisomerase-1
MPKNLVIVESPSKSKTIEKYLGKDYKVLSSKGHIRDLSTKGKFRLGIDVENNFKPDYVTIKGKQQTIKELKKEANLAEHIYLATDPDREGEAISWHLYDALNLKEETSSRIVFNEITKKAILDSFAGERKIDYDLVNSQETRRMLDRIIGFRLSRLMQAKTSGKSAGRVQSVALKLIVEKEREIEKFISEEYWNITAVFKDFEAEAFEYKKEKLEIKNEKEADKILNSLGNEFNVLNIEEKEKSKKAPFPFITSTLQQTASNKLGFSSKKTMSVAQKLYEGIDIGSETVGLITYMRTDSVRLSDEFIGSAYHFIEEKYGKKYIGYVKKTKNKENVQDAHEAIRPSSILREPLSLKEYLSADEYKLYSLIYARALASLMNDAKTLNTSVILNNNDYHFKTSGQVLLFDGYLSVYQMYEDVTDKAIPKLKEAEILKAKEINKEQHFTKPPARYSEASLIKELEVLGIGRPSTYATIIDTLKNRGYTLIEQKRFIPTEIGIEITDKLQECFSHIINVKYTANMENELDEIAGGNLDWVKVLREFFAEFEPAVEKAFKDMEKKAPKETGENCPKCNNPLVVRRSRYGEFVACSNYPECKYIKEEAKEENIIIPCPNCAGQIVLKKSRRGKVFYGCNNYPKCQTAYWYKPMGEKCPKCSSMMLEKNNGETVCSNKDCK